MKGIKYKMREITKYDLCSSCLNLPFSNSGGTVGEMFDSYGWNNPDVRTRLMARAMAINSFKFALEQNGGCQKCINLFKSAQNAISNDDYDWDMR